MSRSFLHSFLHSYISEQLLRHKYAILHGSGKLPCCCQRGSSSYVILLRRKKRFRKRSYAIIIISDGSAVNDGVNKHDLKCVCVFVCVASYLNLRFLERKSVLPEGLIIQARLLKLQKSWLQTWTPCLCRWVSLCIGVPLILDAETICDIHTSSDPSGRLWASVLEQLRLFAEVQPPQRSRMNVQHPGSSLLKWINQSYTEYRF